MLDIQNILNVNEEMKNLFIWSNSHELARQYYESYLKFQCGFEWTTLDIDLHNIPVWDQFQRISKHAPWCLSLTPKELFLEDYKFGVSDNMKKTHTQQFKQWIYTKQVSCVQIDDVGLLDSKHIIKHEQW